MFYAEGEGLPRMRFDQLRTLIATPRAAARLAWPDGVRVACVWLPRLPLRVEVLRHPAWDGLPLVLGGGPGARKVVHLCSPEAERAGIRPGLPLREVVPLCREAIVLQPDPVRTAAVLDDVLAALQHVSPSVGVGGSMGDVARGAGGGAGAGAAGGGGGMAGLADERLFLDLRGLAPVYQADLAQLERAVRQAVPPLLRPRLGLARSPFAAAVAAQVAPPAGTHLVPAQATPRFLAPLPISHLPFPPEVHERLHLLGLRTVGDLARLPFGAVQAQFGPAGAHAWRCARGQDDEPIVPRGTVPSVRAARRFDDPLASVDAVLAHLEHLLAETFAQPALRGRSVRQARLRALLADGSSWERLCTFKEALATREAARQALKAKLALPNGLPEAPIEELSLELLGLAGEAARQASLFATRARQLGQVSEAARHLGARYGRIPLYHAMEVEPWSRIPERRWALVTCDL